MKLAGIRGRSVANPHRPDVCRSQATGETGNAPRSCELPGRGTQPGSETT